MVERYSINFPMMRTDTDPDGPFVRHTDYAALAQERDALALSRSEVVANSEHLMHQFEQLKAERDRLAAENGLLVEALDQLVTAKALKGVREVVAGWNGENRPDGLYTERHPNKLGATLPKTNCGAVYELDEAMQAGRLALDKAKKEGGTDA